MKVREESEKAGLKLNIQKMKIMAFGPNTSWQIDGETMEAVTADDTTLMAESEKELKHLLMKVKEESEKGELKLNI